MAPKQFAAYHTQPWVARKKIALSSKRPLAETRGFLVCSNVNGNAMNIRSMMPGNRNRTDCSGSKIPKTGGANTRQTPFVCILCNKIQSRETWNEPVPLPLAQTL
ncbi:hypothetical protein MRX96_059042 [Rhipicephalus microplus]